MITISITKLPLWERLEKHLKVDVYDKDGGHADPRIRIGFTDLPEAWSRELVFLEMPCVACGRPNHPLRRRIDDGWDRLYYAPACIQTVNKSCSRGRAAELEYERFKSLPIRPLQLQMSLF